MAGEAPVSLDVFVAQVHEGTKSNDAIAAHFRASKRQLSTSCTTEMICNATSMVDPAEHSTAYGCILSLGCNGSVLMDAALRPCVKKWLEVVNEHAIRAIRKEAAIICRAVVADAMLSSFLAESLLPGLVNALEKFQRSKHHLTPFHPAVLQAAIRCKRFFIARQLVDTDVYHLDSEVNATDYLLYHYYGGLTFMALKQYPHALRFLETAIVMPTNVPDAIVISAWYRYQIVTALSTGQQAQYPKHASTACRQGKPHATGKDSDPVGLLVKAYLNRKSQVIEKVLQDEEGFLKSENLTGLAKQLRDRMATHTIRNMTETYITLPLTTIAHEIGSASGASAEHRLFRMIAAGEVNARIDGSQGMVEFIDPTPSTSWDLIQDRIIKISVLHKLLSDAACSAQLEKKYVVNLLREQNMHPSAGAQASAGEWSFS